MIEKAICVLGMHRSGTSCLMGTLEETGIYLGNVSRRNPFNLKGNCENSKIVALHDDLLVSNGGSWDSPPDKIAWSGRHKIIREEIIKDYEGIPCWGFKDPRTLFTLEGWLEIIPNLSLVGIFRNPLAVAQSLQSRNRFSIEEGINLWIKYNEKLLFYYKRYFFPIISFDDDENVFRFKLHQLLIKLGLPCTNNLHFFDPMLRKSKLTDPALTNRALGIYNSLQREAL